MSLLDITVDIKNARWQNVAMITTVSIIAGSGVSCVPYTRRMIIQGTYYCI